MENASKALLMAAEVLIGILVLSLMVYLFTTFGANSAKINKQLEDDRLAEFNSQYDKYVNKDDVTIYDIVTVANLAKENNKYYELESKTSTEGNYYISVKRGSEQMEKKTQKELAEDIEEEELDEILEQSINMKYKALPKYKCEVKYSSITGRVKEIVFSQKPPSDT